MKSVFVLLCFVLFLSPSITNANPPIKQAHSFVSHYENVLGTSMELKVSAYSQKQATQAEAAVLAEINRLNHILSGYDSNSEFSRWLKTNHEAVQVSKDLMTVLQLFDQWRLQSNGALDASAQLIAQIWKEAATKGEIPSAETLENAVHEIQQQHWILDPVHQTATHLTNTPLRLNSFAKSYIIQKATAAAMMSTNIQGLLLNIGGDIVIKGNLQETIQISDPKADAENDLPIDRLLLSNHAIATSGNYRRGELINGKWYSHIVDPRTGTPAAEIISATVIAPEATDAGALATAFTILTPEEIRLLASSIPGVAYLLITKNGEKIESENWKSLQVPLPVIEANDQLNQKEWKNELLISLQLSEQQGFAKRPFAAVWVVDSEGKSVKTIALWFNKPRWLHDLREWYRINGATMSGDPYAYGSITSATRSPGTYTLKWDGKDDKGNILKADKYTIYIEVVREHGGYDLLHQEINCNNSTQQFNLKGNVEIAGVALDYRKKQ